MRHGSLEYDDVLQASALENYKRAVVEVGDASTALFAKPLGPVRAIKNAWVDRVREAEARGVTREELAAVYGVKYALLGILEGDVVEGELEAGQSSGLVHQILPAAEVVRRFVEGYAESRLRLDGFSQGS